MLEITKEEVYLLGVARTLGVSTALTSHPLFKDKWNERVDAYNQLTDKMLSAGLKNEIGLLVKVIEATKKIEQLGFADIYRMAYTEGVQAAMASLRIPTIGGLEN